MIHYRPFRNSDPPALARLWNQVVPELGSARPLSVHELDDHAFGTAIFDPKGLILAESEGRVIGYVHAGFGPDIPVGQTPPLSLSTAMGTIAILVVEPGPFATDAARGLVLEAERYLHGRGASVIYAGGRWPLNPFYWGIYGGAEFSGIVSTHSLFPDTIVGLGYEPIATSVSLQFDLSEPEPREPRAVLIRRQTELEILDDALPLDWWQNLALSEFHLTRFHLLDKTSKSELASLTTFDMSGFSRGDGKIRLGITDVEVAPEHRRKGYGRHLIMAVMRWAKEHGIALLELQTMSTNEPALAFYDAMGFHPIDQPTVYRLPASQLGRIGETRA